MNDHEPEDRGQSAFLELYSEWLRELEARYEAARARHLAVVQSIVDDLVRSRGYPPELTPIVRYEEDTP